MKRYEVEIYEDIQGKSQILEWIADLNSNPSKINLSMLRKLYYQLERLEYDGPYVGEPIVKHIEGKIWEIRPVPIVYFLEQ